MSCHQALTLAPAAVPVHSAPGRETSPVGRPDFKSRALLTDPQTSGGLLVSCAPDALDAVLAVFRAHGHAAARAIGKVAAGGPGVSVI